jgi:hypothetical protein
MTPEVVVASYHPRMTAVAVAHDFAFSRHLASELLHTLSLLPIAEGAGNAGRALAPAVSCVWLADFLLMHRHASQPGPWLYQSGAKK